MAGGQTNQDHPKNEKSSSEKPPGIRKENVDIKILKKKEEAQNVEGEGKKTMKNAQSKSDAKKQLPPKKTSLEAIEPN